MKIEEKNYAIAIYDIAEEEDLVNEYLAIIENISRIIDSNKALGEFLKNPAIDAKSKKEIFLEAMKDEEYKKVIAFVMLLIDKNKLHKLEFIVEEMKEIYLERHNELKVNVKTVIPLDVEQRKRLINNLEKKYEKKILLIEEIDKEIGGGILINVDDEIIDCTFKKKYREIKEML